MSQQRPDSTVPDERIMVQQYAATDVTVTEGNAIMPIAPTTIVGSAILLAGSGTAALADHPSLPLVRGRDAARHLTTDAEPSAGHPVVQRS